MNNELFPPGTRTAIKEAVNTIILCECANEDERQRLEVALKLLLKVLEGDTDA